MGNLWSCNKRWQMSHSLWFILVDSQLIQFFCIWSNAWFVEPWGDCQHSKMEQIVMESYCDRRIWGQILGFRQSLWSQLGQGVCHTVALPFTLKSILRQKKSYGNSNISPWKKYNLQKYPLKETKSLQDIITLWRISSFITSQNIIFWKSSYKNRPIIT